MEPAYIMDIIGILLTIHTIATLLTITIISTLHTFTPHISMVTIMVTMGMVIIIIWEVITRTIKILMITIHIQQDPEDHYQQQGLIEE